VLTGALGAYALDCNAMATPQKAMQCCHTMRCHSAAHHDQDCCRTMPSVRAALGQPSSVQNASFAHTLAKVLPTKNASVAPETAACAFGNFHRPPPAFSPPLLSLRI